VSPILVRPVREQLEHDRLIRYLLANKVKRRLEVAANVGDERVAPVKIGAAIFFPDLVMMDGKKLAGLVEVETGESVNNLEALAEWVHFSKARAPFHLYVPVTSYDSARRLCDLHHLHPAEIWTYRPAIDGFDLVRVHYTPASPAASRETAAAKPRNIEKPAPKAAPKAPPAPSGKNGKAANGKTTNGDAVKNGKAAKTDKKSATKSAKPKPKPARSAKPAKSSKPKKSKR
jgi:hypothetical protein